jgi:hypothetical protein
MAAGDKNLSPSVDVPFILLTALEKERERKREIDVSIFIAVRSAPA